MLKFTFLILNYNLPTHTQVGDGGAGHFVKMVHNGIEYGDMQLICESYHIMKNVLDMDNDEISDVSSDLDGPLIEFSFS